jgi:hypothetical protein
MVHLWYSICWCGFCKVLGWLSCSEGSGYALAMNRQSFKLGDLSRQMPCAPTRTQSCVFIYSFIATSLASMSFMEALSNSKDKTMFSNKLDYDDDSSNWLFSSFWQRKYSPFSSWSLLDLLIQWHFLFWYPLKLIFGIVNTLRDADNRFRLFGSQRLVFGFQLDYFFNQCSNFSLQGQSFIFQLQGFR